MTTEDAQAAVECAREQAYDAGLTDHRMHDCCTGRGVAKAAEKVALTDAEREALSRVVDRATLATVTKAAVMWGMPLLDILNSEGHDEACDALATENLTVCDCWWGKVKRAAEALSAVATAGDVAAEEIGPADMSAESVERIVADRVAEAVGRERAAWAAKVRALHPKVPLFRWAEECPNADHEHDEDENGDPICRACGAQGYQCGLCKDWDGDGIEWPCDHARLLPEQEES